MIEANRRSFLKGIVAIAAVGIVRPSLATDENLPTIWGDLIHDDAPGLNAFLRGNAVRILCPECVFEEVIDAAKGQKRLYITNGTFLVNDEILLPETTNQVWITRCFIKSNLHAPYDLDVEALRYAA